MRKNIITILALLAAYTILMTITGCSSDTEYQRNLHTVGVGFEELAQSGTDVFVFTDTVEPVLLRFITLRYRSKYPKNVTVYFFDKRIPKTECKTPLSDAVKPHYMAKYVFDKKTGIDDLQILKNTHE